MITKNLNLNLSIKYYALGFILLYSFIFIMSSSFALWELTKLQQDINTQSQQAGKNELYEAINNLATINKKTTDKFSLWDEVSQQLISPEYYIYWKTNRLNSSGVLPAHYNDVSIYDDKGKTLSSSHYSKLPTQLNLANIQSYFTINNNIPEFIAISILNDPDNNKILGYVATRSLVFVPLINIKQYNFIKSSTLRTRISEKKLVMINDFINYLSFDIKENKDFAIIVEKVESVLIRNSIALLFFALLFYFLLNYALALPLTKIATYIDRLNNLPEFQFVPKLDINCYILELKKIIFSLTEYQSKLKVVYTNLDEKNKELWDMAHHDALTGSLNRRAFEEQWVKIADLYIENRWNISLVLFDLNHFKSINDSYGHVIGDAVLVKFANAIQDVLRKGEHIYRIGGDEFATILPNCKPDKALRVAQRCHQAINTISYIEQGIKEPIRAGIGIAHTLYEESNISDILWQADVAVYHAKKPNQSGVVTYTKEIKDVSSSILSSKINNIVFNAIENGTGIIMHYQPIIALDNREVDYYEALIRIKTDNEIITPDKIFEIVEAKKLDYELDISIYKKIATDFKNGKIPINKGVSINISGPSIVHNQIIEDLAIFIPYLSQHKIILEITETSLITNINHATENINKLKQQGFLIALDDFGSGYSSISYLSSMPVDIVKFDISLIRQLNNEKQYSIIKYLAIMIKETGHLLVAEGIETENLNDKVKRLGFNYGQGYLYGKPALL